MIGLVVTDEEGTVLWINDLFKERQIDILDENIVEWQPSLATLLDTANRSDTAKIEINNLTIKRFNTARQWL